jgi:repressor LexA
MQEVNFGKYIKELRKACNLKQRDIEKRCGVSNSYLSQLENGQRGIPSPDILKKLAPVLKVSYEDLMIAAGYLSPSPLPVHPTNAISIDEEKIIMVPVYGKIAAGNPIKAMGPVEEYIPLDSRFYNRDGYTTDDFFFLRVKGRSMEPTISDKDLVLIRRQSTIENNEIAAVLCNKEEAAVKRIVVLDDKIILSSDNKDYLPMIYESSECQIIGKVLKKISDIK